MATLVHSDETVTQTHAGGTVAYMAPEIADWEEALALAVTPQEQAAVEAARSGSKTEEVKRQKWLKHYLAAGSYAQAAELVVTPIEAATLLKAKAKAALGPFACCLGIDAEEVESERSDRFVRAVQSYEWDVAQILASSPQEEQDAVQPAAFGGPLQRGRSH